MSERMLPVTGATLASPCQTRSSCMSELMRNKSCDIDRAGVCEPLDGLSISCCISEPETNREGLDDSASLTPRQTTSAAHLPHDVVRHIAQYALQTGGRQHSILALLAMCGVCKHWRQAASHLEKGSNLVFDGTKATTACDKTSTHGQKFRSLSQPERSRVLRAAARLLRGYTSVHLTGDAVDDQLLLEVSHNTDLASLTVSAAPRVTDVGIGGAVISSPGLTSLSLAGTSQRATFGHFLPKVLELRHLQMLEIKCAMRDMQLGADDDGSTAMQRLHADTWPVSRSITHLTVGNATLLCDALLRKCPALATADFDGCTLVTSTTTVARSIAALAHACPLVDEVHLAVDRRDVMTESVAALRTLPRLSTLAVTVGSFILDEPQMAALGAMPLADLRLVSQVYKKQPSLPRPCCSHLDNAAVKALVDAVCRRDARRPPSHPAQPLKLSICGASQLTHDAVSALLRLPSLVKLNIAGCNRIAAMDKMRLIAKIKAGREQQQPAGGAAGASQLKLDDS